jgi:hypothetical protein
MSSESINGLCDVLSLFNPRLFHHLKVGIISNAVEGFVGPMTPEEMKQKYFIKLMKSIK